MAKFERILAEVTQELLDELTEGGTRDLRQTRLSDMEAEVYKLADQLSARLLRGMAEDQAEQAEAECCPCCQGPLEDRPPDDQPIQMKRCEVQWNKPVKRCLKCRRDFFPSSGNDGFGSRSDLQR